MKHQPFYHEDGTVTRTGMLAKLGIRKRLVELYDDIDEQYSGISIDRLFSEALSDFELKEEDIG